MEFSCYAFRRIVLNVIHPMWHGFLLQIFQIYIILKMRRNWKRGRENQWLMIDYIETITTKISDGFNETSRNYVEQHRTKEKRKRVGSWRLFNQLSRRRQFTSFEYRAYQDLRTRQELLREKYFVFLAYGKKSLHKT